MSNTTYRMEKLFRSPYAVPNGIALAPEGLWIVDQISDRLALVALDQPNEYDITQFLRDIPSESSNSSGMCYAHGSLWLAANGAADLWRPARTTDAVAHMGEVLEVDAASGATLSRHSIPGGGGTHGIEVDWVQEGYIWLSTLKYQTLSKVKMSDWSVVATLPLLHDRSHGLVRAHESLWLVYTNQRQIVEMDTETGEVGRIVQIPEDMPEPHGLTREGSHFLYCDATSGWIVRIYDVLDIGTNYR